MLVIDECCCPDLDSTWPVFICRLGAHSLRYHITTVPEHLPLPFIIDRNKLRNLIIHDVKCMTRGTSPERRKVKVARCVTLPTSRILGSRHIRLQPLNEPQIVPRRRNLATKEDFALKEMGKASREDRYRGVTILIP